MNIFVTVDGHLDLQQCAETVIFFIEMLNDQNHRWDCTDREGSWPEPSPNHRPLPCDSESLPASGQQQGKKKKKKKRWKSILNKHITRFVSFQRK